MCVITGTVLTAISVATALASTAMSVVSSVQQGKAQKAQYNYQAAVAKRNAQKAQANAEQTRQEGIEEARMQRMKTIQKIGAQQAAMAANGFDIASGTNLDVVEDTAALGELDALTTTYNAETKALSFESKAENFNNQANLDVIAGENAYRAGITNAIGTGLKGLGDVASVSSDWFDKNSIGVSTEYGTPKASNSKIRNGKGYVGTLPTF